ncbi:MAG TPA: CoA transferase [Anaerolineales bacterium]|nr:CoA transferase [Anaerolineales bacterium]
MTPPLDGIKVLDLSRVLAGPYCTMLLADMGADVVKIEHPSRGDDTRSYGPPFINGESVYFLSVNRNKRSLALDFKDREGREALLGMVRQADVLVENFRPGKLDSIGFGYEDLREINPGLIYCSISGYGHSGPDSQMPGYDLIIQGEGGIASLTGASDGPPYKVGTSQADITAGMVAYQGILLALIARQASGKGQKVDVSLLDCQVSLLTYQAGIYFASGISPSRLGNAHPTIVPYETFQSADGYFNLACGNDSIWTRFCEAAELSEFFLSERFRTNAGRVQHRGELVPALDELLSTRTSQEWIDLLRPAGVPCGRIKSVAEICEDPQVQAREMVIRLDHPQAGEIRVTGIPSKLSETPGSVRSPPPLLGEHTAEVLREWLGKDSHDADMLRKQGAV